jgi:hypothetical protein
VSELNTSEQGELGLTLAPDGLEAFFARATPEDFDPTIAKQAEIYTARRASVSEPFGPPVRVTELIPPDGFRDLVPSLTEDGLTLFFSRASVVGSEEERRGSGRIYSATRPSRDAPFGAPQEVIGLGDPAHPAGMNRPEVSADGLSLYMQYLPIVPGERDSNVYVSHRASLSDPWGRAEPVSEFSSTERWESSPAITRNGDGLFIELTWNFNTSDLPDLRGDSEVYFVSRIDQGNWSKPVNLGDTINKPGTYNWDPYLAADGSTLYFNQMVNSAIRSNDLFQAPVLPFSAESMKGNGSSYAQTFDALGSDASQAFSPIPSGWTFTANDVVFNNVTTRRFPTTARQYAGVYNAGTDGSEDRTLVTDVTRNETGELDFRALVTDDALQALRLGFDIEAWQLRSGLGANPGEAAFHVVLEADSGNGFQQVKDLGVFSTGPSLARPATGNLVDGNDPAYRGSFDTGPIDVGLIPAGATLRTRWISTTGSRNVVFGLDNVSLRFAAPGDANIDGVFDSGDLVQVFQVGQYEDGIAGNSSWSDGDWNNDLEFDTNDLVVAFQDGHYQIGNAPASAVPEPTPLGLLLFGCVAMLGNRRTFWRNR